MESSIMLGDLFEPFQEVLAFSFFVVFIVHILFSSSSHSGWSVEFKTTSEANTFHGSCCTVGMKEKKLSGEAVRAQLSRILALAGCDCSERANVGKVFPPSGPFSSSSSFSSSARESCEKELGRTWRPLWGTERTKQASKRGNSV